MNKDAIFEQVLKAVPLAMGIATIVLSALKQIDVYSGMIMLSIGVCCLAILNLIRK